MNPSLVKVGEDLIDEVKVLKANQLKFQKNNNLPVFLKGGLFDRVLFYSTLGLAGLGLFGRIEFICCMAFPPKPESNSEMMIKEGENASDV